MAADVWVVWSAKRLIQLTMIDDLLLVLTAAGIGPGFDEHFDEDDWLGGGFLKKKITLIWGNDPIWLIFFRWVETAN